MTSRTFKCALCQEEFESAWTEEEALAELKKTFDIPKEECDVVCDECYKKLGYA